MVFLRRMAGLDPRVVFLGAMVGYFFKVGLLGVFLLVFRNADWLSPMAFAVTAILVSLAGTTGEIVAFTRVTHLHLRRAVRRGAVVTDGPEGPAAACTHQMVAGAHLREGWDALGTMLSAMLVFGLPAWWLSETLRSGVGAARGPGPGDGHCDRHDLGPLR